MRQMLRIVVVALFAAASGAAVAAMDPAKVSAAKKAADEFLVMAKGSEASGQVPRQADPGAKALLDRI